MVKFGEDMTGFLRMESAMVKEVGASESKHNEVTVAGSSGYIHH